MTQFRHGCQANERIPVRAARRAAELAARLRPRQCTIIKMLRPHHAHRGLNCGVAEMHSDTRCKKQKHTSHALHASSARIPTLKTTRRQAFGVTDVVGGPRIAAGRRQRRAQRLNSPAALPKDQPGRCGYCYRRPGNYSWARDHDSQTPGNLTLRHGEKAGGSWPIQAPTEGHIRNGVSEAQAAASCF